MSTDDPSAEQINADLVRMYDCNYCEAEYPPDEEYRPGFCSATCEASDRAASVLNIIDHDHRFCNNCFRQVRDVCPPSRDASSKHIYAHEEWGAGRRSDGLHGRDPGLCRRTGLPESPL